ncbi:MAG: class C sortase [Faecousia sp.]
MARRIRQWIGYLIMLAGLGLLAGPFLLGAREERVQEQVVESFYQSVEQAPAAPTTPPAAETVPPPQPVQEPEEMIQEPEETVEPKQTAQEPEDAFYQAAKAYNASLLQNGQAAMTSRSDVEQFALSALDYGYAENIIGTLQIPRMEIELGLYLGANGDNMAKGAAIFGMTSLPLGQQSENVAIAGHRGWRGSPMFREIQKLQMDDPIYLTTPWQTLVYRVCEIRIVTPEDNTWCKIQEGRTLISLMTCHPYGQNYQRYVVFAELCQQEEKPPQEQIIEENLQTFDPAPREVILVNSDGTSETVAVDPASIQPDSSEYGSVLSNVVILAEDKMKTAAWIAAVLVALVGLWLTVSTLRDIRRARKRKAGSYESE